MRGKPGSHPHTGLFRQREREVPYFHRSRVPSGHGTLVISGVAVWVERMVGFFNSLSVRIPLVLIGGVLYGLLTYYILLFFSLSPLALPLAIVIFFLYCGSRLLLLFSGVDTPYYSKGRRGIPTKFDEVSSFYQTAQWVGKFYHYHDVALFIFLIIVCVVFVISLIMDRSGGYPMGSAFESLWNALIPAGN